MTYSQLNKLIVNARAFLVNPGAAVPPGPGPWTGGNPTIADTGGITNLATRTLSGTSAPNSIVTIYDNNVAIGTATANATGNWSRSITLSVQGTNTLTVIAALSGVVSPTSAPVTFILDSIAPAAPVIATAGSTTAQAAQTITGTAESNSSVKLYDNGALLGATAANSNGSWTASISLTVQGINSLTATATDAAGNVSGSSAAVLFTLNTTPPVINPGPPASGSKITDFSIKEWAGNSSPGFKMIGVIYNKGDCPITYIPSISRGGLTVDSQFDEHCIWPIIGDRMHSIAWIRDSNFAGLEARNYNVTVAPGTIPPPSSTITLAQALAGTDISAVFSNVQDYNGTTVATRGSGNFVARLNDFVNTPTRIEKFQNGDICEAWYFWGAAKDTGTGVVDGSLKLDCYVYRLKNRDGSTYSLKVGIVPANGWWTMPAGIPKRKIIYDGALVNNGVTLQTFLQVPHYPGSRWLMCRTAIDGNLGHAPWIGGVSETLFYYPNKAYWVKSGLIAPTNLNAVPPAEFWNHIPAYVPCSAMQHDYAVDGPTGHQCRGNMSATDYFAFLRGTIASIAIARVNNLVGLHVPMDVRVNELRQRPGDAQPDTANTIMSFIMTPKTAAQYDFTADGMPAPGHYYQGDGSPTYNHNFTHADGGSASTAPWSWSYPGESHGGSYAYWGRLYEGDRWHLDAMHSNGIRAVWCWPSTNFGISQLLHNDVGKSAYYYSVFASCNIPTLNPPYSAMAGYTGSGANERSHGYSAQLICQMAGMTPINHTYHNYLKLLANHHGDYFVDSFKYIGPPSFTNYGTFVGGTSHPYMTNWTCQMNGVSAAHAYLFTGHPGFKQFLQFALKNTLGRLRAKGPAALGWYEVRGTTYWSSDGVNGILYNETTNPFVDYAHIGDGPHSGPLGTDLQTITFDFDNYDAWDPRGVYGPLVPIAVGDILYATCYTTQGTTLTPLPAELAENVPYYVVSSIVVPGGQGYTRAFKISATPGGPPITMTSWPAGNRIRFWGVQLAAYSGDVPWSGGTNLISLMGPDSYGRMGQAQLAWALFHGLDDVTLADFARCYKWYGDGKVPNETFPGWNLVPLSYLGIQ